MNEHLSRRRIVIDRVVDVVSVVLLSVTAVFSALCIYQSGRWSGEQTILFNEAANQRVEAGIASAKVNQLEIIDVGLFLRFLEAVHGGDKVEQQFYRERFRPEAAVAIDEWMKLRPLHNPHAPASPFTMPQYHLATRAEEQQLDARSTETFHLATEANDRSDEFLLLTVTFSAVAFLAGMSTKFRFPFHLIVVCLGSIVLVYAVVRMTSLPFR